VVFEFVGVAEVVVVGGVGGVQVRGMKKALVGFFDLMVEVINHTKIIEGRGVIGDERKDLLVEPLGAVKTILFVGFDGESKSFAGLFERGGHGVVEKGVRIN